jgi:hypothetical protein
MSVMRTGRWRNSLTLRPSRFSRCMNIVRRRGPNCFTFLRWYQRWALG